MTGATTNSSVKIYSFGMVMLGRSYSANSGYRFGFNKGSLKDNEIYEEGNAYTTEFRELDVRLPVWWRTDPKEDASQSPYICMGNNPILNNDVFGDIPWPQTVNNSLGLTSGYGNRVRNGATEFHPGVDLGAHIGSTVNAFASGTVVRIGWDPKGYGNFVVVQHKNGYYSLYGHLSAVQVKAGQQVANGQAIAKSGNTGGATSGPHLHLLLAKAPNQWAIFTNANTIDPRKVGDLQKFLDHNEPLTITNQTNTITNNFSPVNSTKPQSSPKTTGVIGGPIRQLPEVTNTATGTSSSTLPSKEITAITSPTNNNLAKIPTK